VAGGLERRFFPGICLEELRKTKINLSLHCRSPGRDLNPEPLEYETGLLITQLQLSVISLEVTY
jgi:hypothetical protein